MHDTLYEQFKHEVEILKRVGCSEYTTCVLIDKYTGFDDIDVAFHIAMRYETGITLFEGTDRVFQGSRTLNDFLQILLHLMDGIEYIQKEWICHKDLHEDNVIINFDTKTSKIIDFGLAKTVRTRLEKNRCRDKWVVSRVFKRIVDKIFRLPMIWKHGFTPNELRSVITKLLTLSKVEQYSYMRSNYDATNLKILN